MSTHSFALIVSHALEGPSLPPKLQSHHKDVVPTKHVTKQKDEHALTGPLSCQFRRPAKKKNLRPTRGQHIESVGF